MNIDRFLKFISPSFTLYSVLLTFAIISFKAFKIFWEYEKDLREENFIRLKDLIGSFRRKYIEPIIKEKLVESVKVTYSAVFSALASDITSPKIINGEIIRELIKDDELKGIINPKALNDRQEKLQKNAEKDVEEFFSAASGEVLFNKLDQLYEQKTALSRQYKRAFLNCSISSYSFLFLSISLFLGILQILGKWPDWLVFLWSYISIQSLIIGVISSICLEVCRRDLINRWEELQFYDKV